ncbi:MAG: SDR family oxidoreductase [Dehalococcoidia bacterium]
MSGPPAVVITGASTGIGEACARRLDRIGYRVFAGVRSPEAAARLREGASERLTPLMLDVTDAGSIARAADTVREHVDDRGLRGLVNNAGIAVPGPLEYLPIDDLRQQLEVNVVGQVAVTQAFLPLLRRDRGRIINMGSISGILAAPFIGAYAASKSALEAISDALRVELRPWGIHVVLIEPGAIATPIWEKGQSRADDLAGRLPAEAMGRYGDAIAAVRRFAREADARGLPPEAVAKVVSQAVRATRPKARYLVGNDARLQKAVARLLPDRVRDRVLMTYLNLPGRASAG